MVDNSQKNTAIVLMSIHRVITIIACVIIFLFAVTIPIYVNSLSDIDIMWMGVEISENYTINDLKTSMIVIGVILGILSIAYSCFAWYYNAKYHRLLDDEDEVPHNKLAWCSIFLFFGPFSIAAGIYLLLAYKQANGSKSNKENKKD